MCGSQYDRTSLLYNIMEVPTVLNFIKKTK